MAKAATPFELIKTGKIVEKLWGREEIFENGRYCLKRLVVEPGNACSIHFHKKKSETFLVVSQCLALQLFEFKKGKKGSKNVNDINLFCVYCLEPGRAITIAPFQPHRFWSMARQGDQTAFIEASTHDDPSDSIRIVPAGPVPSDAHAI